MPGTGVTAPDPAEGGYIERRYTSCGIDLNKNSAGRDPNNKGHKTGDLCWGTWHPNADDLLNVAHLTLPSDQLNGDDDNNEYWKITTRNGTQFYFGLHRLPSTTASSTVTNSVWMVPVFGNHVGEQCHKDRERTDASRKGEPCSAGVL